MTEMNSSSVFIAFVMQGRTFLSVLICFLRSMRFCRGEPDFARNSPVGQLLHALSEISRERNASSRFFRLGRLRPLYGPPGSGGNWLGREYVMWRCKVECLHHIVMPVSRGL